MKSQSSICPFASESRVLVTPAGNLGAVVCQSVHSQEAELEVDCQVTRTKTLTWDNSPMGSCIQSAA